MLRQVLTATMRVLDESAQALTQTSVTQGSGAAQNPTTAELRRMRYSHGSILPSGGSHLRTGVRARGSSSAAAEESRSASRSSGRERRTSDHAKKSAYVVMAEGVRRRRTAFDVLGFAAPGRRQVSSTTAAASASTWPVMHGQEPAPGQHPQQAKVKDGAVGGQPSAVARQ
jgi:hypothetical protein